MADEALDAQFQQVYREARSKLAEDDLKRLTAQLHELRATVIHTASVERLSGKQATRMGKVAAIQTINGFLEIDRIFTLGLNAA
jgi:hypothetical protein